ncbi:MAG: hypothetical protein H6606_06135 [Flavobacteriales bacterium]|nr:hypothetical protein [Flavobacteriales bacterium]
MAKVLSILLNDDLNGVTTMNYAVLKELKDNHSDEVSVKFLETVDGGFIDRFRDAGITVVTSTPFEAYNYILTNNRQGLKYAINNLTPAVGAKWLFFVHSLMNPDSSLPPLTEHLSINLNVYTFSERGEDYLASLGHSPILVRNAIDMGRFAALSPPSEIKKILVLDVRNNTFYRDRIVELSALMPQVYFRFITLPDWDIEAEIEQADMVIAYGRSAIESMAIGKPTIIYGVNGGDGLVANNNKEALAESNYSGWSYKSLPLPEYLSAMDLLQEVAKFDPGDTELVRDYIRANWDVADLAVEVKS